MLGLAGPAIRECADRHDVPLVWLSVADLKAGKRRRVVLKLTERDLSSWDVKAKGWKIVPGCYPLAIGRSSRSTVAKGKLPVAGARC